MKPFDITVILQNSKNTMRILGFWPEKSPTIWYKMRGIISLFLTGSLTILSFIQGVRDYNNENYVDGSFMVCTTLASGYAVFQVWFLQIQKPKFYKIIDSLTDSSVTSHEDGSDIYLRKRLVITKVIFNFQLVACVTGGLVTALNDFVFEYRFCPRIVSILVSQNNDNLLTYISSWSYYFAAGFHAGYVIGSVEGLMFMFLSLGVVQLQILQKQIIQAIDSYPSGSLSIDQRKYYNELVNKLLKECILRHNTIERYISSIKDKFTYVYLMQMLTAVGVNGLIGFTLVVVSPTSVPFTKQVLFCCGDLAQLILVCIPCTEIINQSELVRDACYFSNWWRCNSSVCKTLYIIMERCKRPLHITAGKFSIISLEYFVALLQLSVSYLTVLKNLYAES